MRKLTIIAFFALVILSLYNCNPISREENLTPVLNSISPDSKVSHLPTFTLIAKGSNFNQGSIIVFNGREKQTTYVSSTELTCQVETDEITLSSLMVSSGNTVSRASSEEVAVLVRNPSPVGDSNSLIFTINDNHTFTDPVSITNHNRGDLMDFDLAVDVTVTGNIYVAYRVYKGVDSLYDMFLIGSDDKGRSWSWAEIPNVKNPTNRNSFDYYRMALDPAGNICMLWEYNIYPKGIYFSRSTNKGTSWMDGVQVYDNTNTFPAAKSCIAADGAGNIYVVFENYIGDRDSISLKYTRSTNNGVNWSPPVEIYNEDTLNKRYLHSLYPSIAADNDGNIYTFWCGSSYSPYERAVYFSRFDKTGLTWSQPKKIVSSANLGHYFIAVDQNGNINLAWIEWPGEDYQMYFRRFTDKGVILGEIITLHPGFEKTILRAIAVDSAGNINLLFTRLVQEDVSSLFFTRSIDNGQTWSPPLEIPFNFDKETLKMGVDNAGNIYIAIFYYDGLFGSDLSFSRSNE